MVFIECFFHFLICLNTHTHTHTHTRVYICAVVVCIGWEELGSQFKTV